MAYYNYYTTAANANPELAAKMREAFEGIGLTVETLDFSAVSGNFVLVTDGENEVFKWTTGNAISVCGQTLGVSNLMVSTSPVSIAGTASAVCLMSAQGSNPSPCREVIIISRAGASYMGFSAWTSYEGYNTWESATVHALGGQYQSMISFTPQRSAGNPVCGFSLGTIDGQYFDKCYWCIYAPPAGTTSTGTIAGAPAVMINGYVLMMD